MWVMTPIGFFSAVHNERDPKGETLLVRARDRGDLEKLRGLLMVPAQTIIDTPDADYPHRMVVSKLAFGDWLFKEALMIDYSNFKAKVARTDPKHAKAYGKVWAALHEIEPSNARDGKAAAYKANRR